MEKVLILRDRSFPSTRDHEHMKIDDRPLGVRNVVLSFLTHPAEERLDDNQPAVRCHGAGSFRESVRSLRRSSHEV